VLWRPGCPFCALLLRGLERTGLAFDRVDIWEHPEAAAWVRSRRGRERDGPDGARIAGAGGAVGRGRRASRS
jgi:glutaredoxin